MSLPVPPQPRPSAPQTAFAPTGAAPLVAPPPAGARLNEPKRVKTDTIRPDAIDIGDDRERRPRLRRRAPQRPPTASGAGRWRSRRSPIPSPRTKMAARTPARAAAGAYVVQVSAQKTEAEAQSSYRTLQQKYPSVLGGREPTIRRVELGEKRHLVPRAGRLVHDVRTGDCVLQQSEGRRRPVHRAAELTVRYR